MKAQKLNLYTRLVCKRRNTAELEERNAYTLSPCPMPHAAHTGTVTGAETEAGTYAQPESERERERERERDARALILCTAHKPRVEEAKQCALLRILALLALTR
jgi:hypothetical protein